MNGKLLVILSAALVAFVLIGQVAVYAVNPFHYSSDVEVSDGEIVFSVSARSSEFSVLAYDNGGFELISELYVFVDNDHYSGNSASAQSTFLRQLNRDLDIRNVQNPTEVNAAELRTLMLEPGEGKGILMLSGAFPDTVYSGSGDDPVFAWLESMGSIFWLNGKIGHFVSHDDGTMTQLEGTDLLFFGMDGTIRTTDDNPMGKVRGEDRAIGEMLFLNTGVVAGNVANGLNKTAPGKTLSIGFSDEDGFGSTTLTDRGCGKGMIAVFGGGLNEDVRVTAAQLIASGISYNIDIDETVLYTSKVNGTYNGTIAQADDFTNVYIFIGMLHTVYGNLQRL